jgi:glutathione S-transferase
LKETKNELKRRKKCSQWCFFLLDTVWALFEMIWRFLLHAKLGGSLHNNCP